MTREEVIELVKDKLTISISCDTEIYSDDTSVKVKLLFDGEEIAWDSDTVNIPDCSGC